MTMTKPKVILLGDNTVEYQGHYGSDETHALSAWTSTNRNLTSTKKGRMGALLSMLANNGHHTPFEKSMLHFVCTTDIATHIHILKHRIGVSVNSESGRYKELDDKGYIPQDWTRGEQAEYIEFLQGCFAAYHKQIAVLEARGVTRARAKESARYYLPYGMQYTIDVSFNFRSFWHFLTLRYHEHAQAEVREVARKMLEIVVNLPGKPFERTLRVFGLIQEDGTIRPPFNDEDFQFVPDERET